MFSGSWARWRATKPAALRISAQSASVSAGSGVRRIRTRRRPAAWPTDSPFLPPLTDAAALRGLQPGLELVGAHVDGATEALSDPAAVHRPALAASEPGG